MKRLAVAELAGAVGAELGVSGWREITQAQVDAFAATTDDRQWIHVDPERASSGPFGGTVAHGFLLLSLLPALLREVLEVPDRGVSINYGVERVRFTAPAPVGSRVRAKATIAGAEARAQGVLLRLAVSLELEGSEKPAVVGELLSLVVPASR